MSESTLTLDHVNMPARDPDGLASWYAKTFGLQANKHRVSGPGLLIAFQSGEPVHRAPELHVGFRVQSKAALAQWAQKFGAEITNGAEFCSLRTFDPEGNCVEIYCRADA